MSLVLKGAVVKKIWGTPSDEDFNLIKSFVSVDRNKEDFFVYPVRLCDNREDRASERFSDEALEQLSKKFVGRPGIFNHDWGDAGSIHSRVYKTEVITEGDYKYVLAYAYTTNSEIIKGIKDGILKEVSVGFSIANKVADGDSVCLESVSDAYEFSFVTVPCQPNAGVLKSKNKLEGVDVMNLEEQVKSLNSNIDDLTKTLASKDAEIKSLQTSLRDLKVKGYLKELFTELTPVSEKAQDMACKVLDEAGYASEDGEIDVEKAVELLKADYGFLFNDSKSAETDEVKGDTDVPVISGTEDDVKGAVVKGASSANHTVTVHGGAVIKSDADLYREIAKKNAPLGNPKLTPFFTNIEGCSKVKNFVPLGADSKPRTALFFK